MLKIYLRYYYSNEFLKGLLRYRFLFDQSVYVDILKTIGLGQKTKKAFLMKLL